MKDINKRVIERLIRDLRVANDPLRRSGIDRRDAIEFAITELELLLASEMAYE